jgi:plastocyanin
MIRIALLLLLLPVIIIAAGCGGHSSDTNQITIRNLTFDPNQETVSLGTTIRWFNADDGSHSVVSGVLGPTSRPATFIEGVLDTGFTVPDLVVEIGDTIQFENLSLSQKQIEIKDQNLDDIFVSPILIQNETATFKPTAAGFFTMRDSLQTSITGTLTVSGVPQPDGTFDSGFLGPGQSFEFKPTVPGDYRYFCGAHNVETGVVTVQP